MLDDKIYKELHLIVKLWAYYWHLVDVVWIGLFTMFYLILFLHPVDKFLVIMLWFIIFISFNLFLYFYSLHYELHSIHCVKFSSLSCYNNSLVHIDVEHRLNIIAVREWDGKVKYYNSNLFEADSYLVIIQLLVLLSFL